MRLLLIRHGQTPSNVIGALDTGSPGAELSELGRVQADAVATVLHSMPIAGVCATPRRRTQQTADPLAAAFGHQVVVVPGLEEVTAGDLEMRSDNKAIDTYHDRLGAWMRGDLDPEVPGGEDGHNFLARYDAGVAVIMARHHPGDPVALVSHGAAIRVYAAARASGVDISKIERGMENTELAVLDQTHEFYAWKLQKWTSAPLGGPTLRDPLARDVTGEGATTS